MTTASWHATGQRSNQLHDEGCGRGRTSRILWRRKGAREDEVSRPPTRNPEFLHELKGSRDRAIARSNGSQMCEIRFSKNIFSKKTKNQTMVQKPVPPRVAGLRHQLPPLLRTGARRRRFYGEERGTGEAEYQGAAVVTAASGSDNSLVR